MPPQAGLLGGFATGLISLANYVTSKMPEVRTEIADFSLRLLTDVRQQLTAWVKNNQDRRLFIGITTTTASYQSSLDVAELAKKVTPDCCVVLGGHHASADAETVLRHHGGIVDVVVVGEGEKALCELVKCHPDLDSVPGVAHVRGGAYQPPKCPTLLSEEELDALPLTFRDMGLVGTPGKFDHATYVSARGCPLTCSFCAVGKEGIRAKSIPAVVRDIEQMLDMGLSRIAIEDNFFAHSPDRTRAVCLALVELRKKRKDGFRWDCQTRVESLARTDTIRLLSDAGCEAVYVGVESFNPDQLLYLNKTLSPGEYVEELVGLVVPALLETPIECYLNLQFGLRRESKKHHEFTIEQLGKIGELAAAKGKLITVFPQLHVVYPGTTNFRAGVQDRRFPADVFESFTVWEKKQTPVFVWLGEHFAHGAGGLPEGILRPELLRRGRYKVDNEAVDRITAVLRQVDRLPGIRTFKYGSYLVSGSTAFRGTGDSRAREGSDPQKRSTV